MKSTLALSFAAVIACGALLVSQGASEPRRVPFSSRSISSMIRPGERQIVVTSGLQRPHAAESPEGTAFVAAIAEWNPILLIARVTDIQPHFFNMSLPVDVTPVPPEQANWIGSRITINVERVLSTTSDMTLDEGSRVTFVDEGAGSAVINGTRVDTETEWLAPIERGRRYLIAARVEDGRFIATAMFHDQTLRSTLKGRERPPRARPGQAAVDEYDYDRTPFKDWTMNEAAYWLEQAVAKKRGNTK